MRSMVFILKIILVFIIFLFIISIILVQVGRTLPLNLQAKEIGQPLFSKLENKLIFSEIHQIEANNLYLYVLYGEVGIVQVFDLDGKYISTISVFQHEKGRNKIVLQGNNLLFFDKQGNVYEFDGVDFVHFHDHHSVPQHILNTEIQQNKDYRIKNASIVRIEDNMEKIIIHRPILLSVYQGNFLHYFQIVVILMLIGIVIIWKRRVGQKT